MYGEEFTEEQAREVYEKLVRRDFKKLTEFERPKVLYKVEWHEIFKQIEDPVEAAVSRTWACEFLFYRREPPFTSCKIFNAWYASAKAEIIKMWDAHIKALEERVLRDEKARIDYETALAAELTPAEKQTQALYYKYFGNNERFTKPFASELENLTALYSSAAKVKGADCTALLENVFRNVKTQLLGGKKITNLDKYVIRSLRNEFENYLSGELRGYDYTAENGALKLVREENPTLAAPSSPMVKSEGIKFKA
jgi:hypothetical protein